MSYTDSQVSAATSAMEKYRGSDQGEVGAALVVVGLSAARSAKEARFRDDMIRVAHRSGASLRQLADVSGMDRKTVTAIVSKDELTENRKAAPNLVSESRPNAPSDGRPPSSAR